MDAEVETIIRTSLDGLDPAAIDQIIISIQSAEEPGAAHKRAIDYSLTLRDGFVFIPSDVLGLDELVGAAKDFQAAGSTPLALGKLLGRILVAWSRLREIRVPVSLPEIQIIKALRAGPQTAQDIAGKLKKPVADVQKLLDNLASKPYPTQKIFLIEKHGVQYNTKF